MEKLKTMFRLYVTFSPADEALFYPAALKLHPFSCPHLRCLVKDGGRVTLHWSHRVCLGLQPFPLGRSRAKLPAVIPHEDSSSRLLSWTCDAHKSFQSLLYNNCLKILLEGCWGDVMEISGISNTSHSFSSGISRNSLSAYIYKKENPEFACSPTYAPR